MWHNFWLWVYYNSQTIQAFCAFAGISGLAWYAIETRLIRRSTLAQEKATRRPFIVIPDSVLRAEWTAVCELTNVAEGPALKITWNYLINPLTKNQSLGACAKDFVMLMIDEGVLVKAEKVRDQGIILRYEDTAGSKYWTEIVLSGDASMLLETGEGTRPNPTQQLPKQD